MPQIFRLIEEREADLQNAHMPTLFSNSTNVIPNDLRTNSPPNPSISTRSGQIFGQCNILYNHRAKFSFMNEEFLSVVPRCMISDRSFHSFHFISTDLCTQVVHSLDSFHYSDSLDGCSPDEIAVGVADTLLNLHHYIENTPNHPSLVGFAYTGFVRKFFTVPFHYNFSLNLSSPPRHFILHRRNHATWEEVLTYHIGRYRSKDPSRVLLEFTPSRFLTDPFPMTPEVWHSFMAPFRVSRLPGATDHFILIHLGSNLPVATKLAPQVFRSAVEALVAANGSIILDSFTPEDLANCVQDNTERWFLDGEIYAEYFIQFKDIIFRNFPVRWRVESGFILPSV
ncbi:hypothetical protein PQX77_009686 [Marasmius sp. AFHP31]|nr:hypothetical protein PQX77_009686 [Marasmius sp. AFHP31]